MSYNSYLTDSVDGSHDLVLVPGARADLPATGTQLWLAPSASPLTRHVAQAGHMTPKVWTKDLAWES